MALRITVLDKMEFLLPEQGYSAEEVPAVQNGGYV